MSLKDVDLDDKYRLEVGRIYLSGIQALVRLPTSNGIYSNLDLSRTAIFQQFLREPPQPVTWLDGMNFETGEPRLYALYRLKNLPAITSSSRDRHDALSGWRARTEAVCKMPFSSRHS